MNQITMKGKVLSTLIQRNNVSFASIASSSTSATSVPLNKLPIKVKQFVEEKAQLCTPDKIHICNGSSDENTAILELMEREGMAIKLKKYENCWLTRTDPADVARVESKTFIATDRKRETVPITRDGVKGTLGNWMSTDDMMKSVSNKFPGSMKGRTMYVMPFSMGPVGSSMSKIGVQVTDSPYVVAAMRIMTRMGLNVLNTLSDGDFVKCTHSVGVPLPSNRKITSNWPCNPEETIIGHLPDSNEIISYGSGYGGNSLLGKKCLSLRLGSKIAQREGWLAEHMLILGITNAQGVKKYVAAAFPSACGKTNLAMMKPSLPGYKVECVGDDIAWMKFDSTGQLRAINPEFGFFGVAPGTSDKTNPIAMQTIKKNTLFTNVGHTSDGGVWWEGMDPVASDVNITTWRSREYKRGSGELAAHANSRFCAPASQCPIMDENWQSPNGVPISAIIFGGRRPQGVPLVYESFDWAHGVFIGASMRSEATAAAEHTGKVIMHDPFAMRPFFGYNFGHYLSHWLKFERKDHLKLPKIFHVNWFRKDDNGQYLWPGFGENCRVLDWICRRVDHEDCARVSD